MRVLDCLVRTLLQGLDMNKILGLQDSYLQRQFEMSGVELDRATNSSYMDMTRWGAGGDHHYQSLIQEKSSCPSGRWSQSSAAVTPISQLSSHSLKRWKESPALFASKYLFVQILKYYITPVNDFTDLIVCQNIQRIPNTVFTIVTFVGKVKQRSLGKSITSKRNILLHWGLTPYCK